MRKLTILFLSTFLLTNSYSQITKSNWLWGGNISFSNTKYKSDLGQQLDETRIEISGNSGYFIIDKLAVGLRPDFFITKTKTTVNKISQNNFLIGPFIRYYFLPTDSKVNLFFDGGFSYGKDKITHQPSVSSNTFYFSTGPVVFLNSSVAVEFTIGYSSTKANDDLHSKRNIIQSGIGLQFYLEEE